MGHGLCCLVASKHLQARMRDGFLVGGGSVERNVSPNIVAALDYAKSVGASILGIVGRDGDTRRVWLMFAS